MNEYKGIEAVSASKNPEKVVDLIESQFPDYTAKNEEVTLKIDGKEVVINGFVKDVLRNSALSVVKELRGYDENKKVEITIG